MNETQHRKEVFAWYGAAAHNAQCLEIELANVLLISTRYNVPGITKEVLNQVDGFLSEKTMGNLISILKTKTKLRGNLPGRLQAALKKRNYLMHRFFFEHAKDWATRESREKMLEELKALAHDFHEVDLLLQTVTRLFFKMLGVSEEELEKLISRELREMFGEPGQAV